MEYEYFNNQKASDEIILILDNLMLKPDKINLEYYNNENQKSHSSVSHYHADELPIIDMNNAAEPKPTGGKLDLYYSPDNTLESLELTLYGYNYILIKINKNEKNILLSEIIKENNITPLKNTITDGTYINKNLNFKIDIPKDWTDKYEISEEDHLVSFLFSGVKERKEIIFSIRVIPVDQWEFEEKQGLQHGVKISDRNEYVYSYIQRLDNPYNGNSVGSSKKTAALYQNMSSEIPSIIKSFKFID